jgi:hypothetical protein
MEEWKKEVRRNINAVRQKEGKQKFVEGEGLKRRESVKSV